MFGLRVGWGRSSCSRLRCRTPARNPSCRYSTHHVASAFLALSPWYEHVLLVSQTRIVFSFDPNLYVMGYDATSSQTISVPILLPVRRYCLLR
jgi:hypothetical protein